MTVERAPAVLGWFVALTTASVVAWLTATFHSRRERERLRQAWRQERLEARLDSLRDYVYEVVQRVKTAEVLDKNKAAIFEGLDRAKSDEGRRFWLALYDRQLQALMSGLQAAACAGAIKVALRDEQLLGAAQRMGDAVAATLIQRAPQAFTEVMGSAGEVLRRCDDLAEARG